MIKYFHGILDAYKEVKIRIKVLIPHKPALNI